MIADVTVTEKSFGDKTLMQRVHFAVDDGEKIGVVGRNGIGKSTLFNIIAGVDTDFSGEVIFRRGVTVASTAQEHHNLGAQTVLPYILHGLPEYAKLSHIIETYPETMGENMRKITQYTDALARFEQKGFYHIEQKIERELEAFGLNGYGHRQLATLSGGQKRLVEIIKVMHADAYLALIDEPTNHMDYVAKQQFIEWMKRAREAMLIITHDRDVLHEVDRIIEIKDGEAVSYQGNYDAYLKQNATATATGMNAFEQVEKRVINLKQKVLDYQRLKEKSRNPSTIQKFKRLEYQARAELAELEEKEKPTFWIDKTNVAALDYKTKARYDKFRARTIRVAMNAEDSRTAHALIAAEHLAAGWGDSLLFENISLRVNEGEALEIRGRNGAGKTTLLQLLLDQAPAGLTVYDGTAERDPHARIGIYRQEIDETYLSCELRDAIEALYLQKNVPISETKIRKLCADYLFTEADLTTPIARLSGGQKARFQIISMLANDPQLLVLDEPTNHLDLPSIEELEAALKKYTGAVLYVSHDAYFRRALGGQVLELDEQK